MSAPPRSAGPLDAYRDVPVLVLGAAGFVGRWVARLLSRHGAQLRLVVRDADALAPLRGPYALSGQAVESDLAEPGRAAALCAEHRPAVVFNLAGYGVDPRQRDAERADRINRALPAEVAQALAEGSAASGWRGRALVHAGSALEYGPVDGPVCESLPSRPDTLYGRTKWEGARGIAACCEGGALRAVEGRIFTAYGPGELPARLLPSLLAARGADAPVPLTDGLQQRDFVFVGDVAEALLRLGLDPRPGFEVVHVATGVLRPVRDFVATAARVLRIPSERLRFGALPHRPEEMWHGPVSTARLRRRLDWAPGTDPAAGVEATRRFADGEALP